MKSSPSTNPVGSVCCYAGDLSKPANLQALKAAGWLVCDGASYRQGDFPALYAAIGAANGGDSASFNVPDLRDRLPRGRNGAAANIDPDADGRGAANPGGATGNHVGSLQASATALPAKSAFAVASAGTHTHDISHVTSDMHEAWDGNTYRMARWSNPADTDTSGAHSHMLSGYDGATVPINTALYYIIKATDVPTQEGTTPAGAMAGFAGALSGAPASWVACDGMAYGSTRFPNLISMISYNYGGDGVSVFNVPDLRGNFLRSTDHSTGRDPDAGKRYALNTGGAVGNATGSAQGYGTARPATLAVGSGGDHAHNITGVPQTDHHASWGATGPLAYNCMEWTSAATTSTANGDHTHSIIGGDKESRPVNVYVDWLIAADNLPAGPPVGSIMPIGCDTTDMNNLLSLFAIGWMPCNGAKLPISDPQYAALYAAIGTLYNPGSAPLNFFLPDLRGYFVVGAGQHRAIAAVQTQSQTGTPVNPITTSTDGAHLHSIANLPPDSHVIDVVAGVDLAANNSSASPTTRGGAHVHPLSGGDAESRPVNVYVDYVIRFR
jgi:microcystin-dependent protein